MGDFGGWKFQVLSSYGLQSQKKNHIATITDTIGAPVSDHNAMATLFLWAYKDILGQTEITASITPFANLLNNDIDLAFLEATFTHDEIDAVIKDFPKKNL
jgi:hypothetical protein